MYFIFFINFHKICFDNDVKSMLKSRSTLLRRRLKIVDSKILKKNEEGNFEKNEEDFVINGFNNHLNLEKNLKNEILIGKFQDVSHRFYKQKNGILLEKKKEKVDLENLNEMKKFSFLYYKFFILDKADSFDISDRYHMEKTEKEEEELPSNFKFYFS